RLAPGPDTARKSLRRKWRRRSRRTHAGEGGRHEGKFGGRVFFFGARRGSGIRIRRCGEGLLARRRPRAAECVVQDRLRGFYEENGKGGGATRERPGSMTPTA